MTKNFPCGSERQRLKRGNNTAYTPSEINDLSDMQVWETIFLEIWRLRCQVFNFFLIFIEVELISKTRLCSLQLYSKVSQLSIYITLLTILLFIFFSISSVHVSSGISFVSLAISLQFFFFFYFLLLSNTTGCIVGSSEFLIFFLVNKLSFFVCYALCFFVSMNVCLKIAFPFN